LMQLVQLVVELAHDEQGETHDWHVAASTEEGTLPSGHTDQHWLWNRL